MPIKRISDVIFLSNLSNKIIFFFLIFLFSLAFSLEKGDHEVVDEVICTNFLPVVLSFHFVILSEAKDPTRNHKDPCEALFEFVALSVTKNVKVHLS